VPVPFLVGPVLCEYAAGSDSFRAGQAGRWAKVSQSARTAPIHRRVGNIPASFVPDALARSRDLSYGHATP